MFDITSRLKINLAASLNSELICLPQTAPLKPSHHSTGLTGSVDKPELDLDLKPHSSLLYGNGQGYQSSDADSWEKPLDREKLTLEMTSE